jgi:hypothetical protein
MTPAAQQGMSLRAQLALLFAAIVLCALWLAGITPVDLVYAVFWPAAVLVLLLVVSAQHRAIPLIKIRTMMIAGMTVVPVLVIIFVGLYQFLENTVPFFPSQTGTLVSSVLVEVLLLVPVILLLFSVHKGAWITFTGPLDAALLGAGCGAGFEVIGNLAGSVPWEATPEWFTQSALTLWPGQAAVTAFAGLMLGYGLYIRNRTAAWPVLPALGLAWAAALHYAALEYSVSQDALLSLFLDGRLFLVVFVIAFAISLYLAGRTLQWYTERDTDAITDTNFLSLLTSPAKAPGGLSGPVAAFERFRRLRQVNAYGFRRYDRDTAPRDPETFLLLLFLQSQMKILRQGVPGIR